MEELNRILSPICAACGTRMRCKQNDFVVGHNHKYGEMRWNGDLYNCPQCLIEVVVGFGAGYNVEATHKQDLRLKCNLNSSTKLS